jgi:hypothetical protein
MGLYARLGGDAVWHACTLAGVLLAVVCLRREAPATDERDVAPGPARDARVVAESMR